MDGMMEQRERTFTWDDPMAVAMELRNYSGLEALQKMMNGEVAPPPAGILMGSMGMDLAEEGKAIFTLVPQEYHYNPLGSVHGGIISTLIDTALGSAVQSLLPQGAMYTTSQLNVHFIRPIRIETGKVTCVATAVHVGRKMASAEAKVCDENGKLLAYGSTTCTVF